MSSNTTVPQPEIEALNASLTLVKQVLQNKLFSEDRKKKKE